MILLGRIVNVQRILELLKNLFKFKFNFSNSPKILHILKLRGTLRITLM